MYLLIFSFQLRFRPQI